MKLRINLNEAKAVDPKKVAADKKKVADKKKADDKKAADKKKVEDKKAADKKKADAKKKQLKEALRPMIAKMLKENFNEMSHDDNLEEMDLSALGISGADLETLKDAAPILGTILGVGGTFMVSYIKALRAAKTPEEKERLKKALSSQISKSKGH